MRMRNVIMASLMGFASLTTLSACQSTADALQIGDAATKENAGPCPRAFALYDASRIVEFKENKQSFNNVGFTGEIANVRSLCRYFNDRPIEGDVEIVFDLGRGPAASGDTAIYEYFIAVTRKNVAVIEKEVFPMQVTFPAGEDRVRVVQKVDNLVIPRATPTTSGVNFEIIVGFEVTAEQRAFNAEGRRFRLSAGQN